LIRLNQPQRFVVEQLVAAEAGIALAAVGVQDPKAGSPARWAGPITGDDHLRSLADLVPAEPDPRSTGQLEPDPGRLAHGGREARAGSRARARPLGSRRLEHDEADSGAAREGGQAAQSIGQPGGTREARRQVHDQEIDRPTGQERAGDRQAFLGIRRGEDDKPLRLDPTRDRFDGVERRGQVQPGDDRAGCLCLGREPERERRPTARHVAPERHAHPAGHATGTEDGIELGKPGRVDRVRVRPVWAGRLERDRGQRADHLASCLADRVAHRLADRPRRGRAPARSKRRQGRRQVR
jgi:hypothetical protein